MAPRMLTPLQRRRIQQAIRDGHLAFVAELLGPTAIDREDYDRLRAAGKIRDEKLMHQDAALAAHALGTASGLGQEGASHAFWRHAGDDPQVITEAEREAVVVLRDRVSQHVVALGHKLEDSVTRVIAGADNAERRRRLTGAPGRVAGAFPVQDVLSRIRAAVSTLRRDWLRVVHTEIHNAAEEARAVALAHGDPGRDPRVFKRPHPDACAFCRILYLKPDEVTPRVFRLSALLANGTNEGRRAGRPTRSGRSRTEWKATLGAIHPFCRCPLQLLADGMGFDGRGQLVHVGTKKSASIETECLDATLVDHACEE